MHRQFNLTAVALRRTREVGGGTDAGIESDTLMSREATDAVVRMATCFLVCAFHREN